VVIWTAPAKADLRAIHDHIAEDSPYYAKQVVQAMREKADQADPFPMTGKMVPEVGDPAFREFHLYSYRIIYEIRSDDLKRVLAVVHKRQDFKAEELPS
jgi:toxin ParE1/3/4